MGDLISREDLLEALKKRQMADEFADHGLDWENATLETRRAVEAQGAGIKRIINSAHAVDAVPVRHGKWVYHDDDVMPWNSCSLCGCSAFDLHGANYCPNCGARMDEEVSGNGQAQD